jgi:phosphoribosylformylglycinamidine synthase
VSAQVWRDLGLNDAEYQGIVDVLGREPTYVELAMYSLMWSEHCSYKHSKKALAMFPTDAPWVLQGPGENAGVVDIGDGWAVAFKMESHNHPSAIEPYQGAATGVGGIIRDIFTMGARPIASLDSLRFGELDDPRQRYLFDGVVAGIGGYGNCLGVPTIGGEVYFEDAYKGNCLVNAMSVGIMRADKLTRAVAAGPGNHVLLIGNKTGRDGIGGASVLASQTFDEGSEAKRPSVQVGDPFTEKLLIETCLELLDRELLQSLGDFGAAGLTSCASEMASRGRVGMDIHVDRIPLREADMEPFEIMISESQERMLAVVTDERLAEVQGICTRWGLTSTVIGEVTDTGNMRIFKDGVLIGDMPARSLAHDAPEYDPPAARPAWLDELHAAPPLALGPDEDLSDTLTALLAAPNIASKSWVWQQYDHQVILNTVVLPGSDAAVLRAKETGTEGRGTGAVAGGPEAAAETGMAFATDANGRHCYLDPYEGGKASVCESARNVACSGAKPYAITNCLNFGDPDRPEIFYQFSECIRGMADACRAYGIPVISGNVSFYNESFGEAIYPTPTVGMMGLMSDVTKRLTSAFAVAGDEVVLLGETLDELHGTEYAKQVHARVDGKPPAVDLEREAALARLLVTLADAGAVASAHDCSDGGLAVCLAESAIQGNLGVTAVLPGDGLAPQAAAFAESHGRAVVTCRPQRVDEVVSAAQTVGVPAQVIGATGGDRVKLGDRIDVSLESAANAYTTAIAKTVQGSQRD